MKLISLMCIAFVILLTSFPARGGPTFNPNCLKNLDTCGRLVGVKDRWRPECCKFWRGNVLPETKLCACYALNYTFGRRFLPPILNKCKLGGIEQFKCYTMLRT
uniref:Putative LTP-like protein n=1 Tax=Brassica oleracea var. alboglabra TaxID=3714 RepID=A7XM98_BRAOA|nr:putative LTP-like protein [Brassica oleracea var. alboglabra]